MVASASNSTRFEGGKTMAKCENCGKIPTFGNKRSHSMKATRRQFKPNLQTVRVMENGQFVRKTLCAKCIKTLSKA
jgi:large subunit ribosomal protein L28